MRQTPQLFSMSSTLKGGSSWQPEVASDLTAWLACTGTTPNAGYMLAVLCIGTMAARIKGTLNIMILSRSAWKKCSESQQAECKCTVSIIHIGGQTKQGHSTHFLVFKNRPSDTKHTTRTHLEMRMKFPFHYTYFCFQTHLLLPTATLNFQNYTPSWLRSPVKG